MPPQNPRNPRNARTSRTKPSTAPTARERELHAAADLTRERAKLLRQMDRVTGRVFSASSFQAASAAGHRARRDRTGSAESHLAYGTRDTLVRASRDLYRNDPLYRAVIDARTDLTVGAGLWPQADSGDEAWDGQAERLFREWAEGPVDSAHRMNFGQLQRLVLREADVAGDCLTIGTNAGLQIAEAEQVVSPWMFSGQPDDKTFDGVEIDTETGEAVAYWVAAYEPGVGVAGVRPARVNAADAVFLTSADRVSQRRGQPALACALTDFMDLDEYTEAALVQAKLGAFLALVGTTADPGSTASALGTSGTEEDEDGNVVATNTLKMKPGRIFWMNHGDEIKAINHNVPGLQFDPFWRSILARIAAAARVPPEIVLLSFAQMNWSSMRGAVYQADRSFEPRREWFVQGWCARVWRWKIAEFVAEGRLRAVPGMWRSAWTRPAIGVIDAQKEALGQWTAFDKNLRTFKDIAAENGYDSRELLRTIAAEKEEMRRLGITPALDPGAKAVGAASIEEDEEKPAESRVAS